MFERFGEDARQVVARAWDEASSLSHDHVGTEHLLLGLLSGPVTPASEALTAAGASLAFVREMVVEALASRTPGRPTVADRDLPLTPRANRALDRAGRLSLRMGADEVHAEHILLGLITVEGTAGQVLRGLGVDPAAVKDALESPSQAEPAEASGQEEPPQPRGQAPLCASCGASLSTSLGRARLTVGKGGSQEDVDVFYCTACGSAIGANPG